MNTQLRHHKATNKSTTAGNNKSVNVPFSAYPLGGHFARRALFRSCPARLHPPLKERQNLSRPDPRHDIYGLVLSSSRAILTIVAVVVDQNDLFDQVRRAFLQDTEQAEGRAGEGSGSRNWPQMRTGVTGLPDHGAQQSGASFVVEGDDDAGRRQLRLPLFMSATARGERHIRS